MQSFNSMQKFKKKVDLSSEIQSLEMEEARRGL